MFNYGPKYASKTFKIGLQFIYEAYFGRYQTCMVEFPQEKFATNKSRYLFSHKIPLCAYKYSKLPYNVKICFFLKGDSIGTLFCYCTTLNK